MDEDVSGSGGTITDYSGNEHDGTAQNNLDTNVTGVLGAAAVSIDSSDESHIEVNKTFDEVGIDDLPDSEFTLSAWVKRDSGGQIRIMDVIDSAGVEEQRLAMIVEDGGSLFFDIRENTDESDNNARLIGGNVVSGEWTHVAFVNSEGSDADSMRIYINGEDVSDIDEDFNPTDFDTWAEDFVIGGRNLRGEIDNFGDGEIDELILINEALSESEVRQLYFNGDVGDNFEGKYTSEIFEPENGNAVEWNDIEITASIDASASCDVEVKALDEDNNQVDSVSLTNINDGADTYDISDLADSPKIQLESTHEVDIS